MINKVTNSNRFIYIFIILILFIMIVFVNSNNVFAYDIEGSDEKHLYYLVASSQNIVYYDIDNETAQEAVFEVAYFLVDCKTEYSSPSPGYIIKDNNEVLQYSSNSQLISIFNYTYSGYLILFIVTSNRDVFYWRYDIINNTSNIYDDTAFNHSITLDFTYNFSSVDRNLQFYSCQYNGNDVSNKIDDAFYFENLVTNFGVNNTGSCAYVALGMLLSYYDIFFNNEIIDDDTTYYSDNATSTIINGNSLDTFIEYEIGNSYSLDDFNESPGSTNAFHNYLVYEIGRGYFNYGYDSKNHNYVDGLSISETRNVLDYYLNNVAGLSSSEYEINIHHTEQSIMDAIDDDKPVLIGCHSWAKDMIIGFTEGGSGNVIETYLNIGHAMIAYGYEETNDGVFFKCHAGWFNNTLNSFSDCFILSFGDNEIKGLTLDLNTTHVCSQAYINNQSIVNHPFCANCGSSGYVELGSNDVLTHLHAVDSNNSINHLVYNNIDGPGFYKLTLTGTKSSGVMVYNSGAISLYDDSARTTTIDRLDILNYNYSSVTNNDENSMWVYLPRNGYFYIDINMPNVSYTSLSLTISEPSNDTIDIFDMPSIMSTSNITLLSNISDHSDFVKEIEVKQPGVFTISYSTTGTLNNNYDIFLVKKDNLQVIYSNSYGNGVNRTLEEGVYYLGYFNLTSGTLTDFHLNRFIENTMYDVTNVLITDPHSGSLCGSEINIIEMNNVNKSYRGTNITVGYTRLIYFDQIDNYYSLSRLDYYWYSSDESKALVTQYGTVYGISHTLSNETVTILAILKSDPSIIFIKEFTINNDDGTGYMVVESNISVKNSDTNNGLFHLHLENCNVPYPMYSYYTWNTSNISNGLVVTNENFGNYTVSGAGSFDLVGANYIYNTNYINVVIVIHVTITNN